MANRFAVASGNWSNTATWNGGTLPTSADVVRPNNFNVTIDQDITVEALRNDAAAPAVAGGTFTLTGDFTVNVLLDIQCFATNLFIYNGIGTAYITKLNSTSAIISSTTTNNTSTVTHSGTGTLIVDMVINSCILSETNRNNIQVTGGGNLTCIQEVRKGGVNATTITSAININTTINATVTINNNVFAGSNSTRGIRSQVVSFINVNGNVSANTLSTAIGIETPGTLVIVGNVFGGGNTGTGISVSGTTNIIGNVFGGTNGIGVANSGIITVTGNVYGGTNATTNCSGISSSNTVIVTGDVFGGNTFNSPGIASGGICTINGNINGGIGNGGVGVIITSGTLNHVGICRASAAGSAIVCNAPTTSTITCTGPFLRNGYTVAISSQILRINTLFNPYFEFKKSNNIDVTYVNQSSLNFPATSNVRNGITYGSGVYTGTMIVPSPIYVRFGIPTDNTVGTAIITAADLFNEIAISPNPLAVRLRTVSTVGTVGQQLITYNNL